MDDNEITGLLIAAINDDGSRSTLTEVAVGRDIETVMECMMAAVDALDAIQIPLSSMQTVTNAFIDVLKKHAEKDEDKLRETAAMYRR